MKTNLLFARSSEIENKDLQLLNPSTFERNAHIELIQDRTFTWGAAMLSSSSSCSGLFSHGNICWGITPLLRICLASTLIGRRILQCRQISHSVVLITGEIQKQGDPTWSLNCFFSPVYPGCPLPQTCTNFNPAMRTWAVLLPPPYPTEHPAISPGPNLALNSHRSLGAKSPSANHWPHFWINWSTTLKQSCSTQTSCPTLWGKAQ